MNCFKLTAFYVSAILLIRCSNSPSDIPLPDNNPGTITPKSDTLIFSAPTTLNWYVRSRDSIKTPETLHFDIDAFPVDSLRITRASGLKKPLQQTRFNWNSLKDSSFQLKNIPATKLNSKTAVLGIPIRVKAGFPRLKDGAATNIFMFGQDQGLPGTVTSCFMFDKNNALWIGMDNGLSRYDGEYFNTYTVGQGLSANWIVNAVQDKKGRIWISFSGIPGINVLDIAQGTIKYFTVSTGFPTAIINDIMLDKEG